MPSVRVQNEDFDTGRELESLTRGRTDVGAVASFTGVVRSSNDGSAVDGMTLEHYPGMTEKALEEICGRAHARWNLIDTLVIHRVAPLNPGDRICSSGLQRPSRRRLRGVRVHHGLPQDRARRCLKRDTRRMCPLVESRASDNDAAGRWTSPRAAEDLAP